MRHAPGVDRLVLRVLHGLLELSCLAAVDGLIRLSCLGSVGRSSGCRMSGGRVLGAGGRFYGVIGDFPADHAGQTAPKESGRTVSSF